MGSRSELVEEALEEAGGGQCKSSQKSDIEYPRALYRYGTIGDK